jgi:hypothetical protein
VCNFFGQTEASLFITKTLPDDPFELQATTVGLPLLHSEVKLINPATGTVVPCGERGELCCRGYQVMAGYYQMPQQTNAAIDSEGWLHTGDLATMNAQGYLTIVERLFIFLKQLLTLEESVRCHEDLDEHPSNNTPPSIRDLCLHCVYPCLTCPSFWYFKCNFCCSCLATMHLTFRAPVHPQWLLHLLYLDFVAAFDWSMGSIRLGHIKTKIPFDGGSREGCLGCEQ